MHLSKSYYSFIAFIVYIEYNCLNMIFYKKFKCLDHIAKKFVFCILSKDTSKCQLMLKNNIKYFHKALLLLVYMSFIFSIFISYLSLRIQFIALEVMSYHTILLCIVSHYNSSASVSYMFFCQKPKYHKTAKKYLHQKPKLGPFIWYHTFNTFVLSIWCIFIIYISCNKSSHAKILHMFKRI